MLSFYHRGQETINASRPEGQLCSTWNIFEIGNDPAKMLSCEIINLEIKIAAFLDRPVLWDLIIDFFWW